MVKRLRRCSPAQIILIGFMLLILAGALLLTLPGATRDGDGASFADALFTATSATCVTGLVVHDTAAYWSGLGQAVILCLIQIGGMGVVTMAVALSIFSGKRIGLKQRIVMQESIAAPQTGGIVRLTGFAIRLTLLLEGVGAGLLALRLCPQMGLLNGLWSALFHAVSAFCNAGFDLMGAQSAYSSLTAFTADPLVNLVIAALIILGGLGFTVWDDIRRCGRRLRAWRLHTKLVVCTTAALVVLPSLFFFFYEFARPAWGALDLGERALASFFQSVTPRTAGFNTVDLTRLSAPSLLLVIALMLIGGSPGSTAGGFKTTTLSTLLMGARAVFRRRQDVQAFGRRLPDDVLRGAASLMILYAILFASGGMLICLMDGVSLKAALFESASALGTVGLSLGITPQLSLGARGVLVALMFIGRVGGLTMVYAVASRGGALSQMPQERVMVG